MGMRGLRGILVESYKVDDENQSVDCRRREIVETVRHNICSIERCGALLYSSGTLMLAVLDASDAK